MLFNFITKIPHIYSKLMSKKNKNILLQLLESPLIFRIHFFSVESKGIPSRRCHENIFKYIIL